MNKHNIQIIKDGEIDIRAFFQLMKNDIKRIISIIALITSLGIIYVLLMTPLYKSTITMYPTGQESGGQFSQLQGMASTFGFDLPSQQSFHIPDIVLSRLLKTKLIYNEWNSREYVDPINLIHYWKLDDKNKISLNPIYWIKSIFSTDKSNLELKWEENALEKIDGRISIKEEKSGLISVDILMEEPRLAADMANTIYPTIMDITIDKHMQQAKINREFIEQRQIEVQEELSNAENKLKEFRQRNRSILESPLLQLEMERLIREVEIKTQVYITLQQQYELARIDEVKETPSVLILDSAVESVENSHPKTLIILLINFIFGIIITIIYSLTLNFLKK